MGKFSKAGALALASLAVSMGAASAQRPNAATAAPLSASGWTTGQVNYYEGATQLATFFVAYTTTGEAGDVMLQCGPGGFKPRIALTPVDFDALMSADPRDNVWSTRRVRFALGQVYRNGEQEDARRWAILPEAGIASTDSAKVGAMFFNGAVRGDDIQVQFANRGTTKAKLPPVDDAFKTFAANCQTVKRD